MRRAPLYFAIISIIAVSARAQEFAPGTRYDPAIPTLEAVVGHAPGEAITSPEGITAYLEALAAAAPDRTRLVEYARTWEGRPLHVLAIASPARMTRLDEVKASVQKLADPRSLAAGEGERLVADLPVITMVMAAVHGNETSSSDAALLVAYHLLAAQGDADVDLVLRESVVLVDPLENPDGRARFLATNALGGAAEPDPEPVSAEHDEGWPGGRGNHYLFDMNRDWFASSQPETRGRLAVQLEWHPQVVMDLHEMGGNSSYYFAPPAPAINPLVTKEQSQWLEVIGQANAKRFDERGFAYFVREVYDSFYPGYGDSWPGFQGAVSMTFEQASPRGLAFRKSDGTVMTYRDGVLHHFTSSLMTATTAARNREALLKDFLAYRRSAIDMGRTGVRAYLLPPGADPSRARLLAENLAAQGIEVGRAAEAFKVGEQTFAAGTYVVSTAQPSGRLVRNLLAPEIRMDDEFIKRQAARREEHQDEEIYDITAWSLPLVFDIDAVAVEQALDVRTTPVVASPPAPSAAPLPAATVGYLLPWGAAAAAAVADALADGIRVRSAGEPFTLDGRRYGIGTALVRSSDNGSDLAARLGAIVARHGAEAVPIDSSWVDDGISLGSNAVVPLEPPRVVMAWDQGTSSLSAGWARFVLERRYGQKVTAVKTSSFGRLDLNRYDVMVLPSGSYSFNADLLQRIKDWLRAGGTLVTLGEASRWAATERVGLLSTFTELRDGNADVPPAERAAEKPPKSEQPFDLEKAIEPERQRPESLPGAILRVELDGRHWMSAGEDDEIQVMVEGNRVFRPIKLDSGANVGVYAEADRLVASGLVWPASRDLRARKAFLMDQPTGQGHVIAFAEDPNFRAFTEATELLFLNAVLLGPGY